MKNILIYIFLTVSFYTHSQRYSKYTPKPMYKSETFEELYLSIAPNFVKKNNNSNNEEKEYLVNLKNWIKKLNKEISEKKYIDLLETEYKNLKSIENQNLSNMTSFLKETEQNILEIINKYKKEILKLETEEIIIENSDSVNKNQKLIELAINYYKKNEFAKSVSTFSKYLETDKNNTNVLFYRAMAKSELNDFYGALNDYNKIIELNSDYPIQVAKFATVYNNKAYTMIKLDKNLEALVFVEKALELDKTEWYIWDTRGEIYFNLEKYEKSLIDLNKAIELKENDNSYFLRGLVLIKLNLKEKGCNDLSKSGELGNTEAYEKIKIYCN